MEIPSQPASSKAQKEFTLFLLFLAVLFGGYVRIYPVLKAGFPLIDGGLFYSMITDLVRAGFHLPVTTSYNHLNIPFAYPPLALYFTGTLQSISGLSLLELIRWLPVFFSLLTIPAFFLLAGEMLHSRLTAALATVIFALLPRSYEWTIMGGGVTRAPAALFFILFCWAVYLAFQKRNWKATCLAALLGGLILLTHPERGLHAAVSGVLFWLWLDRSRAGAVRAILIGAGTLLVSAPWWGTVLARYGIETFFLAAHSAGSRWLFWIPLLQLNFTDESAPLMAILAVLGLFLCWKKRQGLLAAWFLLSFLADPRSAPHVIAIQVSLLAGLILAEIILPGLGGGAANSVEFFNTRTGKAVFGYLLILMLFNAQMNLMLLGGQVLSNADRQAMAWIRAKVAPGGRFLVVPWQENAMLSPLLEWFPALSERTAITTIQGREWLPGLAHYNSRMDSYPALNQCLSADETCLDEWAFKNNDTFDYIYLPVPSEAGVPLYSRLSDSLLASANYRLVYDQPEVLIFLRNP
jgi:hypothetical protein